MGHLQLFCLPAMKCGFVIFCANAYEDWQQEVAETAEMLVTEYRPVVSAASLCLRKRNASAREQWRGCITPQACVKWVVDGC